MQHRQSFSISSLIGLVPSAFDTSKTFPHMYVFFFFCFLVWCFTVNDCTQTGGPAIQIPTGRRDGKVSSASNVRPNIVDTSFTMDEMIKLFSSKGLSLDDLVTLSGTFTTNHNPH